MSDNRLCEMTDEELGKYVADLYLGTRDYRAAGAAFRPLLIGAQKVSDLDQVRADITRTAAVVQALTSMEHASWMAVANEEAERLTKLLARERELMKGADHE